MATTAEKTSKTKYVYGSGKDLQNAQSVFTPSQGYQLVDVSTKGFDPSTMQNDGIMLGGSGVNKNVTDNILSGKNITRLYGNTANETSNRMNQYMDDAQKSKVNSLMPTNTQFNFDGNMQDYLDQAQGLLKPQYDLSVNQLNKNYDSNIIPGIENDTLKRGLARSSYAGNRVDQANESRQDDLNNLSMQQQQAINNLGMQNYNTAYDRAYQQNNDQFNRGMSLYNAANQDLWQNKNFNADQTYKAQQQGNWQKQFDTSNNQWQKQYDTSNSQWQRQFDTSKNQWQQEFNFNKTNADRDYQLKLQQMAQAAARASRSGGSGSRGGSGGSYSGGSTSSVNGLLTGTKAQKANASSLLSNIYNDAQSGNNYDALLKYRNAMAASSDKTQQAAVSSIKKDIGSKNFEVIQDAVGQALIKKAQQNYADNNRAKAFGYR